MFITRAMSLTNFFVATSALGFQVCVLYPWHKQLDDDFGALRREHLRVLNTIKGTVENANTEKHKGAPDMFGVLRGWRLWGKKDTSGLAVDTTAPASTVGRSPVPPPSSLSLIAASQIPQRIPKPSMPISLDNLNNVAPYSRYALAGAVCCSFTHAILTPMDIVKTRIQLDPQIYNRGIFGGLRQVIASEGAGALATGLGPTVAGYFLQGAFKFGGYEFLKTCATDAIGYEAASKNRHAVFLGSSAIAEIAADIALCPFEAVRIRLVSQPGFGHGLLDGFARMVREEGIRGLYSGLGPILLKQVPYTVTTFVVYENALEQAYKQVDKSTISSAAVTGINLLSGLIAGVAAALVSQPADTMLSKINKEKSETGENTLRRLWKIARDMGLRGSYAGIRARLVMVGGMTAVQFAIYGDIKKALGATGGISV